MSSISSLTHLEILKGYKDHLYTLSGDNKSLEIWLLEVVAIFEQSVYQSEVSNTGIISEMNHFVVRFNQYKASNELAQAFKELIDSAEKIIDKAISSQ